MTAVLREQWLTSGSASLARRRALSGLSLVAMAMLGVIALYQIGIIDELPDPPLPGFDADAVHGSRDAYSLFATPDAILGMGSYAVTLTLAAAGDVDRTRAHPWLPLALGTKTVFDAAQAGRLLYIEIVRQRALSLWSLVTEGTTVAAVPLALAEAREALGRLGS